ncbi:MAG: glycosyltransferase family 39 protein [Candidatus Omnitrophica bacterium]|nr:glycosyltransferase family 39 protein [Candidatus Omnitrophota bacterium]
MKKSEIYIKFSLFIICAVLFLYNLGSALPIIEMEKFYFQSVKEMFARGDWITPYYHGQFRFAKPILFYWCVSLSYLTFGINNFAARFPSALFAIFTVLTTFSIGRRLFDPKTGLLAAGMTATFALFFMYARYASPDMALTFMMTYAIYLFIRGAEDPVKGKGFFMAFFAMLGLATATKGLGGFILPLIAAIAYIVSTKKWNLFKSMNIPLGLIIMLAIGLPWYLLMYKLHGDAYLHHIVAKETVKRVLYSPENKGGLAFLGPYLLNFFDYVPALLVFFIPHSAFLPAALIDAFKNKHRDPRERDSYKLVLSFFFTIFVVFTLMSSKIYHYMLPIAPAFGLLVARYLINLERKGLQFKSPNFNIMYAVIIIVYAIGIPLVLYIMRHLYPSAVPFYNYAIILLPVLLIVPYWQKKGTASLFALPVVTCIFLLFVSGKVLPLLNDNIFPKFSEEIRQNLKEGDKVAIGSIDISQQQLSVYLDMPIDEINVKWKDRKAAFPVHRDKLITYMTSGSDCYLVISENDYEKLIPDDLKAKLVVMDEKDTWKSRLRGVFEKSVVEDVLNGRKDLLKDVLRHKVYLVTNKQNAISQH